MESTLENPWSLMPTAANATFSRLEQAGLLWTIKRHGAYRRTVFIPLAHLAFVSTMKAEIEAGGPWEVHMEDTQRINLLGIRGLRADFVLEITGDPTWLSDQ